MVGILLISHGHLGEELISAMRFIVAEEVPHIDSVPTGGQYDLDRLRQQIEEKIKRLDHGDGVLILTDMFGGTPSNLGLAFLEEGRIEIVSGVNLPMLIKLATYREGKSLSELAAFVKDYGRRNIIMASEILRGAKRESPKAEDPS